ncbi:hypothetical protein ACQK5W_15075 [Pantoea sp. FN060301]
MPSYRGPRSGPAIDYNRRAQQGEGGIYREVRASPPEKSGQVA